MRDRRAPSPGRRWRTAARLAGVGTALTGAVVGGLILGMLLDRWLGTTPWLGLAGLLLGAAGGFLELFRTLRAWQREEERSSSDPSSGPSSSSGSS